MAIMNVALLALLPYVLAMPQVGHGEAHKGLHPRHYGTGPFNHHHAPAATGGAPFPVPGGNGTQGGASGSSGLLASTSSSGPVVITSVINVIPTPVYNTETDQGAGNTGVGGGNSLSPASATGGAGYGGPGNGGPGGPGASGSGAGGECGPATVTVTNANTVTVTVTPAGQSAGAGGVTSNGGGAPASSLPVIPSSAYVPPVQSAPFPIGNSSAPAGTGTAAPVSTSLAAAVVESSSTSVPAAQPYHTPAAVAEKYAPHGGNHGPPQQGPPAPVAPTSSAYVAPPVVESSAAAALVSSSAPVVSSPPTSGGAKGVAYNTPAQATQISGLSWACNWGQTAAMPNPPFEFVPQLWGTKDGMTASIGANCAGAKACLFYNEPDKSLDEGGSAIDWPQAATDFGTYMAPIRKAGTKVSTPCVANDGAGYMESWLGKVGSGNVDIMCFHWYGNDAAGLKSTIQTFQGLASQYGIPELWINEWAVQPAPSDLSTYISTMEEGKVTRYAYNMNDMEGSTGY